MPSDPFVQARAWALPTLQPRAPIFTWLASLDAALESGAARAEPVALDLSAAPLNAPGLRALVGELGTRGLRVVGVCGVTAEGLGAEAARLPPILAAGEAPSHPPPPAEPLPCPPLTIDRTLRSGQVVRHGGDVAILGGVSSGAEIFAGGSIHIHGVLHGRAFAGHAAARIFCRRLEAELLSIGGVLLTADDIPDELRGQPVMARLADGVVRLDRLD